MYKEAKNENRKVVKYKNKNKKGSYQRKCQHNERKRIEIESKERILNNKGKYNSKINSISNPRKRISKLKDKNSDKN
jgi:hypothetical protein